MITIFNAIQSICLLVYILSKWINKILFKMQSGSHDQRALRQYWLPSLHNQQEEWSYLLLLPQQQQLPSAHCQKEASTAWNSRSPPMDSCSKQPFPNASWNPKEVDFPVVSLDVPMVHHSLRVSNCNSRTIPK